MVKIEALPPKLKKEGLEEKILEICESNDIRFMAIFSSFIKGQENTKSDIDVAIEFLEKSRKDLFDLTRVEDELRKMFGRKVDLGIFSAINPYIIEDIKKEMLVIYEKDKAYLKDMLNADPI